MRFLLDRCAGRRLAEWLGNNGHDVVEAQTLGPDPGFTPLASAIAAYDMPWENEASISLSLGVSSKPATKAVEPSGRIR